MTTLLWVRHVLTVQRLCTTVLECRWQFKQEALSQFVTLHFVRNFRDSVLQAPAGTDLVASSNKPQSSVKEKASLWYLTIRSMFGFVEMKWMVLTPPHPAGHSLPVHNRRGPAVRHWLYDMQLCWKARSNYPKKKTTYFSPPRIQKTSLTAALLLDRS